MVRHRIRIYGLVDENIVCGECHGELLCLYSGENGCFGVWLCICHNCLYWEEHFHILSQWWYHYIIIILLTIIYIITTISFTSWVHSTCDRWVYSNHWFCQLHVLAHQFVPFACDLLAGQAVQPASVFNINVWHTFPKLKPTAQISYRIPLGQLSKTRYLPFFIYRIVFEAMVIIWLLMEFVEGKVGVGGQGE